jgi:hypothetical protein
MPLSPHEIVEPQKETQVEYNKRLEKLLKLIIGVIFTTVVCVGFLFLLTYIVPKPWV